MVIVCAPSWRGVAALRGSTKLSKDLEVVLKRGKLDLDCLLIALKLFYLNSVELSALEVVHVAFDSDTLDHGVPLLAFIGIQAQITDDLALCIDSFNIGNQTVG